MRIEAPNGQELQKLLGKSLFSDMEKLASEIEARYSLDKVWHSGGKKWVYELKYRKGSKTICALLFKEGVLGFMVIFGKQEQAYFEEQRGEYSPPIIEVFEAATPYHDGKWLFFEAKESLFADFMKLLLIKRKPDKKP